MTSPSWPLCCIITEITIDRHRRATPVPQPAPPAAPHECPLSHTHQAASSAAARQGCGVTQRRAAPPSVPHVRSSEKKRLLWFFDGCTILICPPQPKSRAFALHQEIPLLFPNLPGIRAVVTSSQPQIGTVTFACINSKMQAHLHTLLLRQLTALRPFFVSTGTATAPHFLPAAAITQPRGALWQAVQSHPFMWGNTTHQSSR